MQLKLIFKFPFILVLSITSFVSYGKEDRFCVLDVCFRDKIESVRKKNFKPLAKYNFILNKKVKILNLDFDFYINFTRKDKKEACFINLKSIESVPAEKALQLGNMVLRELNVEVRQTSSQKLLVFYSENTFEGFPVRVFFKSIEKNKKLLIAFHGVCDRDKFNPVRNEPPIQPARI